MGAPYTLPDLPAVIRPEDVIAAPAPARRALSASLEAQLLTLCNAPAPRRIEALALERGAPESLAELLEATRGNVATCDGPDAGGGSVRDYARGAVIGERIPVYAGASARTIWSRPEVNWLFRAWHDSHHILIGAEFDPRGEREVASYACAQIHGRAERAILWAEVWGQVEYFERWQAFPYDQRAFVRDCIRFGLDTTVARGVYHRTGDVRADGEGS